MGSYNPRIYGFNESDFYDGMHLKKEAIDKLFKESNDLLFKQNTKLSQ